MKVLVFDISNLIMRCLFAQIPGPEEMKFDDFKTSFLNSLIKTIKDNNPDKVIIAEDSESWRKEIYPAYKANRIAKREKSVINFDVFFPILSKFMESLQKIFLNIQFIKIPRCEADDIIAVIVKNYPEWDIINISSDKDFYQLFAYKNYKQYDGLKHEFIEHLNPKQELLVKVIHGDSNDNIPGIRRGVGIKRAIAKINDNLEKWLETENLTEAFNRNMQLISFNCIPKQLEENIISAVNNFIPGKFNSKAYFKLIQIEGLPDLMSTMAEYNEILKKLDPLDINIKNTQVEQKLLSIDDVKNILFPSEKILSDFKIELVNNPLNNGNGGCLITEDSVMEAPKDEEELRLLLKKFNYKLNIKNTNDINPYYKHGEKATSNFINYNCAEGDFIIEDNNIKIHIDLKTASKPLIYSNKCNYPFFIGGAIGKSSIKFFSNKPNYFYLLISLNGEKISIVNGKNLYSYIKSVNEECYKYDFANNRYFISINTIPQKAIIDNKELEIWKLI